MLCLMRGSLTMSSRMDVPAEGRTGAREADCAVMARSKPWRGACCASGRTWKSSAPRRTEDSGISYRSGSQAFRGSACCEITAHIHQFKEVDALVGASPPSGRLGSSADTRPEPHRARQSRRCTHGYGCAWTGKIDGRSLSAAVCTSGCHFRRISGEGLSDRFLGLRARLAAISGRTGALPTARPQQPRHLPTAGSAHRVAFVTDSDAVSGSFCVK